MNSNLYGTKEGRNSHLILLELEGGGGGCSHILTGTKRGKQFLLILLELKKEGASSLLIVLELGGRWGRVALLSSKV